MDMPQEKVPLQAIRLRYASGHHKGAFFHGNSDSDAKSTGTGICNRGCVHPGRGTSHYRSIHTAQLISAMVKAHGQVSDLIFSPRSRPEIKVTGQLVELKYKGLECLSSQDTLTIAHDILGQN